MGIDSSHIAFDRFTHHKIKMPVCLNPVLTAFVAMGLSLGQRKSIKKQVLEGQLFLPRVSGFSPSFIENWLLVP